MTVYDTVDWTRAYLAVVYLIVVVVAAVTVGRIFAARRPRGIVATPHGPMAGPSDHALRQARRYYGNDVTVPVVALGLIPRPRVPESVSLPCPVGEGTVVEVYAVTTGRLVQVEITVVVPRPGSWDGASPQAGPTRFQYLGIVLPDRVQRIAFHQSDIWRVAAPASMEDPDDAA